MKLRRCYLAAMLEQRGVDVATLFGNVADVIDVSERFLDTLQVRVQGCQIFHGTKYQNGEKYVHIPQKYQMTVNIPNDRKIYQVTVKYTK
jgi:hypothetical protein